MSVLLLGFTWLYLALLAAEVDAMGPSIEFRRVIARVHESLALQLFAASVLWMALAV